MRILIAEDEPISRRVLETTLIKWGYDVIVANDGNEAWHTLRQDSSLSLAILDWMMPGMDGLEICKRLQTENPSLVSPTYTILLTARGNQSDIVQGLDAGADDYIVKPFNMAELRARIRAGERIVQLQWTLAERVRELEEAISHVQQLQGLLPICCYCKKIRDDGDFWHQVETYIARHSDARFTHGICPECYKTEVKPQLEVFRKQKEQG